jgi:hypothetical protein
MAKKKRELTTRRMPSGAQQYVRPAGTGREMPVADRMRTLNEISSRSRDGKVSSAMTDAIIDESVRGRIGRMSERQTTDEDFNNAMRDIRAGRRKEGGKMESKKMATRPTERPTRAPAASKKPTPRPSTAAERAAGERGNRQDPGAIAKDMKAGGKVKKMAMGGKCRGMGAATKGGNFSRG